MRARRRAHTCVIHTHGRIYTRTRADRHVREQAGRQARKQTSRQAKARGRDTDAGGGWREVGGWLDGGWRESGGGLEGG
eukprot:15460068-Alexandrium_andersonii.AAC.1